MLFARLSVMRPCDLVLFCGRFGVLLAAIFAILADPPEPRNLYRNVTGGAGEKRQGERRSRAQERQAGQAGQGASVFRAEAI